MLVQLKENLFTQNGQNITLAELVDKIKYGFWKEEIQEIRACEGMKWELKKKLPVLTATDFCIVKIELGGIKDHLVKAVIELIKKSEFTLCSFVTCSKNSLCVFVKSQNPTANEYYKQYISELSLIGAYIEEKGAKHQQFISYDPNIYFNPNSEELC